MDTPAENTPTDGQGQAAAEAAPVQPTEPVQEQPSADPDPADSSQGLIEPYLNGLDDAAKSVVAPVLERFRSEQDARVNAKLEERAAQLKQYEQYGDPQQLEIASTIYQSIINDPVSTVQWIMDKVQSEMGIDVRSQIVSPPSGEQAPPTPADGEQPTTDKPLTQKDLQEFFAQQQREAARAQQQQQLTQQAIQRTQGWLSESIDRHKLPAVNDGVKQSLLYRANAIRQATPSVSGQNAIDMAVQEFSNYVKNGGTPPPSSEPTVAQGGTPPPAPSFDITDKKQRQEAMESRLAALTSSNS